MFDVSPERANLWFDISNFVLLVGAILVALGTYGTIKFSGVKEKFADERIAANEAETKRAVADSDLAKEGTAKANERIALLNNDAARLTADNLALQTALLPRHVGLVGFDEQPRAKIWFAGFERWAGTKILIQVVPGDPEAQNLANEIAIVLSKFGWIPEFIDEVRSGMSLKLSEGLNVYAPGTYKAWDPHSPEQQIFSRLNEAKLALASALTKAGLGVGEYSVSDAILIVDFPPESDAGRSQTWKFNPTLDGVYVQVGSRPVGATVAWIKRGRPDRLGGKSTNATPVELQK